MRTTIICLFLCLFACASQSPKPDASYLMNPDKETLRLLRELDEKAQDAEPQKAAKLSVGLVRTRLNLFALGVASRDENLLIVAGGASKALGPCAGERTEKCDRAILDRIRQDLDIIKEGGEEESARDIFPLFFALQKITANEPEGIKQLLELTNEDSSTGVAARLFVLGRVAEIWQNASNSSATDAIRIILDTTPFLCGKETIQDCFSGNDWPKPYQSKTNIKLLTIAEKTAKFLHDVKTLPGELSEAARKHAVPNLEAIFALPLPLEPIVNVIEQVQAPKAQLWRESLLSIEGTSQILQTPHPRLYLSLTKNEVRLGMAPAVHIIDAKSVLFDKTLGYGFPGKLLGTVKEAKLSETLRTSIQEAHSILEQKGQQVSEKTIAILADTNNTVETLVLLANALQKSEITNLLLLISPKSLPEKTLAVFGAAIPFTVVPTPQETQFIQLNLYQNETMNLMQITPKDTGIEKTVLTEFQNQEELKKYAETTPISQTPFIKTTANTSLKTLVETTDLLRVFAKGAWGSLEKAPIQVESAWLETTVP